MFPATREEHTLSRDHGSSQSKKHKLTTTSLIVALILNTRASG
jgi:hypothetical protein